jgi:hypothetical protein
MGLSVPSTGGGTPYLYSANSQTANSGQAVNPGASEGAPATDQYVPSDPGYPSFQTSYGSPILSTQASLAGFKTPSSDTGNGTASTGDTGVIGTKQAGSSEAPGDGKCKTCAERKYQDGSNDPGVSFKAATHVSPDLAPVAVMAHEGEHVVREQAKAESEGREVVSQHVSIHTAVCPECGRIYVSGGTTTTVTKSAPEPAGSGRKSIGVTA